MLFCVVLRPVGVGKDFILGLGAKISTEANSKAIVPLTTSIISESGHVFLDLKLIEAADNPQTPIIIVYDYHIHAVLVPAGSILTLPVRVPVATYIGGLLQW